MPPGVLGLGDFAVETVQLLVERLGMQPDSAVAAVVLLVEPSRKQPFGDILSDQFDLPVPVKLAVSVTELDAVAAAVEITAFEVVAATIAAVVAVARAAAAVV